MVLTTESFRVKILLDFIVFIVILFIHFYKEPKIPCYYPTKNIKYENIILFYCNANI